MSMSANTDPQSPGLALKERPQRSPSRWKEPELSDYLIFFVGIPAVFAFVFSLTGIRLTNSLPWLVALVYMLVHMFTAWWSISIGAATVHYLFRNWKPPMPSVCLMGYFLVLIPTAYLYQKLGDAVGAMYPVFEQNRAEAVRPSWDIEYMGHFIRYSLPSLPLFLGAAYSHRWASRVNWFGYERADAQPLTDDDIDLPPPEPEPPRAGLIEGSNLPDTAEIIAIKAEQHYIRIWSDAGTDLVRYRFMDLADALGDSNATQVHRSWWVNLGQVRGSRTAGRNIELDLGEDLKVPVSLSYKKAVLERIKRK